MSGATEESDQQKFSGHGTEIERYMTTASALSLEKYDKAIDQNKITLLQPQSSLKPSDIQTLLQRVTLQIL